MAEGKKKMGIMATISSNTIVKNGMPFIGKVLEQVAPYMEKMFVTISEKSDDGTIAEVNRVYEKYPDKLIVDFENVSRVGLLTEVEQAQANKTTSEWILFLSDDDYWPKEELLKCIQQLDKDPTMLAYSVNPYQMIDWETHDSSWAGKAFSKFLRQKGLRYVREWPDEMPADENNQLLYRRQHPKVKELPYKFYHLPLLKGHSFRNEAWAGHYKYKVGTPIKLDKPLVI